MHGHYLYAYFTHALHRICMHHICMHGHYLYAYFTHALHRICMHRICMHGHYLYAYFTHALHPCRALILPLFTKVASAPALHPCICTFLIDLFVGTYRLSSHARLEAFVIQTKLNKLPMHLHLTCVPKRLIFCLLPNKRALTSFWGGPKRKRAQAHSRWDVSRGSNS